jgi:proteasome maturation protein
MDGMMAMDELPFKTQPHDAMRLGLASLKEDALLTHPVEQIQQEHKLHASAKQLNMMRQLYGTAVPAKLEIESQILSRFTRLPGLPSSKLGLEAMTGELDDFSFESYLGQSQYSDAVPPELHSQMELALNMGTKPVTRGMF